MTAGERHPAAGTLRFDVQVSIWPLPGLAMLRLSGPFGDTTRALWDAAAARALSAVGGAVIVDLADVAFTDDVAVTELADLGAQLAAAGRKLALINVYDPIRDCILRQKAGHLLAPGTA